MAPIKCVRTRIARNGALAVDGEACPLTVEAIQNWSFRVDRNSGKPLSNQDPQHNQSFYSHMNKALAYAIDYLEGGPVKNRYKPKKINWNTNNIRRTAI